VPGPASRRRTTTGRTPDRPVRKAHGWPAGLALDEQARRVPLFTPCDTHGRTTAIKPRGRLIAINLRGANLGDDPPARPCDLPIGIAVLREETTS
jgi:hypothetical protein